MDASIPGVRFDRSGCCNHCAVHDRLNRRYPAGQQGRRDLERIGERMRRRGRRRKYDCIVGVSGGRDTSYCLHVTKELGLRPLAVHFDNGWDSDIAKRNLSVLCSKMDVDLHTVIADWEESRELTNCSIRASVPYIDMTDDVGIARALYDAAVMENIPHIVLSHSFREEGINPLLWNYFDGKFFEALVRQYARIPIRKTMHIRMRDMLYWHGIKGIRIVNFTNYYDDAGKHVERLLAKQYGWVDTHQHHYDNELFALVSHYSRIKFRFDWRVVEFSAKIRSGVMSRDEGRAAMAVLPTFETPENIEYCLTKQGISAAEWQDILAAPPRYFTDYPNSYATLKLLKHPIKWLGRANILPAYIYEKYFET